MLEIESGRRLPLVAVIFVASIAIRLAAMAWSLVLLRQARDWRMGFLTGMLGLMALRQALTLRALLLRPLPFATRLRAWQDEGVRDLAFVIGGADGLEPAFRDAADVKISFGLMTWPHMMVRCMLVEQIYRAESILAGHPYHKS